MLSFRFWLLLILEMKESATPVRAWLAENRANWHAFVWSGFLLLFRLVFELGEDAFVLLDVLPRAQIHGLIQGVALFEGIEVADFDHRAHRRHVEVGWNGHVAARNPALTIQQAQFDAPLVVDLGDHGRTGGVELVLELVTAAVGSAWGVRGIQSLVLSEGQNLQDAAIIVNFDLPWAIIRLIQRAGRVDRIGQKSDTILCYSFLPADGVNLIIRLRERVRQRLRENAEVVGTDEAFFEDEKEKKKLLDLYHEKAGILDGDDDREVDLASYAYQVWKNAIDRDPNLQKSIPELPAMVYSTKQYQPKEAKPPGVLVYVRTAEGNDALAWVDNDGKSVTESQFEILRAAECAPDTPSLPRMDQHHLLVRKGVEKIVAEEKTVGGQLGRPSGARFRTYERLKRYAEMVKGTLFDTPQLNKAIEDILFQALAQGARIQMLLPDQGCSK
jgi:hypothetical protein